MIEETDPDEQIVFVDGTRERCCWFPYAEVDRRLAEAEGRATPDSPGSGLPCSKPGGKIFPWEVAKREAAWQALKTKAPAVTGA